jgi:choline dehydrogenase-like flavoprotein
MLFDFNEAWPRLAEVSYDVCVCGAGPSGITVARKLAEHGKSVLLLEGGGLAFSEESQNHYAGKSIGKTAFWWLETGRLRYFGGASNHWGGLCAVIESFDKTTGENHSLAGWPISGDEVLRYFDEGKDILDVTGDFTRRKAPGFDSPLFDRWPHGYSAPTRFGEKYREEIRRSKQIDAFYNANVVDIKLEDSLAQVKHFVIRNYKGDTAKASAKRYVVAFGGIENPRALLNANSQIPAGIGNGSDWVGRCFMESLSVTAGRFVATDPAFFHNAADQKGMISFVPTKTFMERSGISDGVVNYFPHSKMKLYGRLRLVKQFVRDTICISPTATDLARHVVDFNCPSDGIVNCLVAQEPNPRSRLTLGDEVDSFGLRRLQMDWQFIDVDFKTIRRLAVESAKEMARLNLARAQLVPFILDEAADLANEIGPNSHHMGTTRMSSAPRDGVVDKNCQVHGIHNLYMAGGSVFSTSGGRNPTMTIVLLALRLGDFLGKV